jgi:hypothetical protein
MTTSEEKYAVWAAFVESRPPQVRFASNIRANFGAETRLLDHVEYMMSLMEAHPLIPFGFTFGSDLFDLRRGLAYEIVLRQLAHTRSLVANINIKNRPGVGTAVRCMLEMFAFAEYILDEKRIEDGNALEKLYHGRAFTPGGWYDIEQEWEREHGVQIPNDAKELLKALLNLPHIKNITKPLFDGDKGASYIYSVYSEFVHPAFERPRGDIEAELGHDSALVFGSSEYHTILQTGHIPLELLKKDLSAGSLCLQLFWPRLLDIDPFLNDKSRNEVIEKLKQQGLT